MRKLSLFFTCLVCGLCCYAIPTYTDGLSAQERHRLIGEEIKAQQRNIQSLMSALSMQVKRGNFVKSMIQENNNTHRNRLHRSIIESSLNAMIQKNIILKEQEAALATEIRIQEASSNQNIKVSTKKMQGCSTWPLPKDSQLSLSRDYGKVTDIKTKISWQHTGWLLSTEGQRLPVYSCADGRIVYIGLIPGRGYVVLIDHGSGYIATYGHLEFENLSNLKVGHVIRSGAQIGSSSDKIYFEIRKSGNSLNPRQVFSKKIFSAQLNRLSEPKH